MPQPPSPVRKGLHGLPARPCPARRRTAHQHHDPAASGRGTPYRLGQHPVVLTAYVPGQQAHPGHIGAGNGPAVPGWMNVRRCSSSSRRAPAHTPSTTFGHVNAPSRTAGLPCTVAVVLPTLALVIVVTLLAAVAAGKPARLYGATHPAAFTRAAAAFGAVVKARDLGMSAKGRPLR